MKKFLFVTVAFLATSQACFALLSPLSQSIVEYRDLINNPELGKFLNQGETILDIKKVDRGYIITTNRSELFVDLVFNPSSGPGPQNFRLHFNKPRPLNSAGSQNPNTNPARQPNK